MKKILRVFWATLAAASFTLLPTSSIRAGIMLDGVPEASYVALAQESQFNSIGRFAGGTSGTLIAPNWVLTAAHTETAPNPLTGFQVRGTGTVYGVAQVILHPSFVDLTLGFDIALVRLSTPVLGITPASIYRGTTEIGQTATITGFGKGGIGSLGLDNLPAIQRAGTNRIDQQFTFSNGAPAALLTDFDNGTAVSNTTGTSATTTNEYQLADRDSGGGMFIFENGEWKLAGINSGIGPQSQGGNNLAYGAFSVYTRVSSFQQFIDDTLVAVPEPSSFALAAVSVGALTFRFVRRRRFRAI